MDEPMVEDYTGAFLVSFGVLIFVGLLMIWSIWGLIGASIVGAIADRVTVGLDRLR